jgi:hypothetical protein
MNDFPKRFRNKKSFSRFFYQTHMFLIQFRQEDGAFEVSYSELTRPFHRCFTFDGEVWSFEYSLYGRCLLDESNCLFRLGGQASRERCRHPELVQKLHQAVDNWDWESLLDEEEEETVDSRKIEVSEVPCCSAPEAQHRVLRVVSGPDGTDAYFLHNFEPWTLVCNFMKCSGASYSQSDRRLYIGAGASPLVRGDRLMELIRSANGRRVDVMLVWILGIFFALAAFFLFR